MEFNLPIVEIPDIANDEEIEVFLKTISDNVKKYKSI
jgi:hypothetical protein